MLKYITSLKSHLLASDASLKRSIFDANYFKIKLFLHASKMLCEANHCRWKELLRLEINQFTIIFMKL